MPKNIEDIIVPERRRSIRDIPIPEGRRRDHSHRTEIKHDILDIQRENFTSPRSTPSAPSEIGRNRNRKGLWVWVAVALLLITFASLSLFNGGTLSYTPRSETLLFNNDTYTARKIGEEGLLFSIIKLSLNKGLDVPALGEENVERKASGNIVIYNTNTKAQKLRETTRFATPDGKTYQIKDAIVIPAKKVVGGVEKPGTLEVVVHAEFPGEEYNIGLADFTLPGLKGTSLSSSVYARSKSEMTGGFKGKEKIVQKVDLERVKTALETLLKEELISEAKGQVPEDFILLPSLSSVTFENLPQSSSTNENNVTLNMRGNLQGVMFKKGDLSTELVLKKINTASNESVIIPKLDSLVFSFTGVNPTGLPTSDEVKFTVNGEVKAIWRTDEVALKADLVGRHKEDISSILKNYPSIVSATATLRPFWKTSFPSDNTKIFMKELPVD